jgi:putative oxidoreductase
MWSSLNNCRDGALLFLRVALGGFYFWIHGFQRIAGGPKAWQAAGAGMEHLHLGFFPLAWGFLGACAATVGVLLVILGLCFRPACLLISGALIALSFIQVETLGVVRSAHSIELAIVAVTLLFLGPGRYSFDGA